MMTAAQSQNNEILKILANKTVSQLEEANRMLANRMDKKDNNKQTETKKKHRKRESDHEQDPRQRMLLQRLVCLS